MKKAGFLFVTILLTVLVFSCDKQQTKTLSPSKDFRPALIVIDIQNEYLPAMDQKEAPTGMESINTLIGLFREHNYPVIRVHHSEPGQGPYPGEKAFEFPESVKILDSDDRIIKNYPSAFVNTSLDSLLKAKGCNTVYLCGLSALGCVLATYFGAMERHYEVFMVREAVFSQYADFTQVIRAITRSIPLQLVSLQLRMLSGDLSKLDDMPADSIRKTYGITSPDELNGIGYSLLSMKRFRDAIIVMKANLRMFPDEPNCYDSLGEIYENDKQKDLALANYEKAYLKAKEKNDKNINAFEKNYQRLKNVGK